MRCPYCRQNIRIQGRFCPACGEQIFGLPVERPRADRSAPAQPSQPAQTDLPRPTTPPTYSGRSPYSGPADIDIELDSDEPAPAPTTARTGAQPASAEYVGKICPYCRFPIKPGEEIVVCPACKVPHHAECWQENNGCTTYGCTGTVAANPPPAIPATPGLRPPRSAAQPASPPPDVQQRVEDTFLQMRTRELNARATSALVLAFLGILCFLPAIIAFFMGIGILGQLAHIPSLASQPQPAKGRAIAAIVVAPLMAALNILFISAIGSQ